MMAALINQTFENKEVSQSAHRAVWSEQKKDSKMKGLPVILLKIIEIHT